MESNEIYTLIKYTLCLIFLLFTVIYIFKPWLQHCFVQWQKKLDFKQKKEMEYQLLAMSKVKAENQEINELKKERDKLKKEIEDLQRAPDKFKRTALIYRLIQKETKLTAASIKEHQEKIDKVFDSLGKVFGQNSDKDEEENSTSQAVGEVLPEQSNEHMEEKTSTEANAKNIGNSENKK